MIKIGADDLVGALGHPSGRCGGQVLKTPVVPRSDLSTAKHSNPSLVCLLELSPDFNANINHAPIAHRASSCSERDG